jgi:hypothetical protein
LFVLVDRIAEAEGTTAPPVIDAELAEWNARAHREFLGTRDYRGPRTT